MIWPFVLGAATIGSLSRRADAAALWLLARALMLTVAIAIAVALDPADVDPAQGALARWGALVGAVPGTVAAPAGAPAVYLAYAVLLARTPGWSTALRVALVALASLAALAIGGHSPVDVLVALAIGEAAAGVPLAPRTASAVGNPAGPTGDPAPHDGRPDDPPPPARRR